MTGPSPLDLFASDSDVVVKTDDTLTLRRTAIFSLDGRYRYALGRMWAPESEFRWTRVLVVIGLNPSTATESEDDPTIRRCMDYAMRWGHQGLTMLNLFAYRATDPRELERQRRTGVDLVGGPAQETALQVFTLSRRVLCAWGVHGAINVRGRAVRQMLRALGRDLVCLGQTKSGEPKHPLYLRADLQPEPYL